MLVSIQPNHGGILCLLVQDPNEYVNNPNGTYRSVKILFVLLCEH